VSTEDQTCNLQLDELRSYVQRRGWAIFAEYVDTGWSGAKDIRPQFNKLMTAARKRHFDIIVCWKVDRFGRSVANFVRHLQDLDSWGVRFLVTTQAIDTDAQNPSSRLLMQILSAVAEFERAMIVERVKAGIKAAQRRGVVLGRKRVIVDKTKILALHLRGKSINQIAAEMKLSHTTVQRTLERAAA
jgi:DNA invertase Pin-like site-specific DNA recombinase